MRKTLFILILLPTIVQAQLEYINAIAQDMLFLSEQYVTPAAEAAVYQSSGGWYTSAKRKKQWDLEISLQGNLLFINSKHKDFLIRESDLQNLSIVGDATTAYTPTALGGAHFVELAGDTNGDEPGGEFEFDSPEGLDEPNVKHAQLQAALGVWKGTDIIVRYSPKIKLNKTYYQILGFGAQHNLSQWFVKDSTNTFNVAAMVSYSFYSVSDTFSEVKLPINGVVNRLNSIVVDGESFMFNVIASKEVKQFTFSSAIGFTSSNFEYTMGGEGIVIDILNQTLEPLSKSKTLFKADIGIDYRLGDFSANTMVTFGKYTNLILGLNYNL